MQNKKKTLTSPNLLSKNKIKNVKNEENACVPRAKAVPLHRIYALLST